MVQIKTQGMPSVLILCPFAEWLVPTGQSVENLADLDETNVLRRCVECGRDHEWTRADAVLVGRLPAL